MEKIENEKKEAALAKEEADKKAAEQELLKQKQNELEMQQMKLQKR